MLPRIKNIEALDDFKLYVTFDDGTAVIYDVTEDIETLPGYNALKTVHGLFKHMQLDESRTCVYWTEDVDLPSDILYEYGKRLEAPENVA